MSLRLLKLLLDMIYLVWSTRLAHRMFNNICTKKVKERILKQKILDFLKDVWSEEDLPSTFTSLHGTNTYYTWIISSFSSSTFLLTILKFSRDTYMIFLMNYSKVLKIIRNCKQYMTKRNY